MNAREAVNVLEDAIGSTDEFAVLTTAPTKDQIAALNAVPRDDIAPGWVNAEFDLAPGSTWGDVVTEVRKDARQAFDAGKG